MPVNQLGVYWPFKTLLQGAGIAITEDSTTIRITNTGGTGGSGGGDMLQSQFATNGNPGVVDHAVVADGLSPGVVVANAALAQSVPWSGVTGAPTSFPSDWSLITSKPTVFPPATHGPTHRGTAADPIPIADTTDSGLLALLSGASTDYVGGDNQCHSLPQTIQLYGALPPGSMVAYAGATLPGPTGTFFFCQGQAVSRSAYAALYAAIGVTYGSGDGSTTFNLPDMRGRGGIGVGQGTYTGTETNRVLGAKGGEETHTIAVAEMPSHAHGASVGDPGHAHTQIGNLIQYQGLKPPSGNDAYALGSTTAYGNTTANATNISVSIAANGGGGAHNNMHPFLVLNYIIKT